MNLHEYTQTRTDTHMYMHIYTYSTYSTHMYINLHAYTHICCFRVCVPAIECLVSGEEG